MLSPSELYRQDLTDSDLLVGAAAAPVLATTFIAAVLGALAAPLVRAAASRIITLPGELLPELPEIDFRLPELLPGDEEEKQDEKEEEGEDVEQQDDENEELEEEARSAAQPCFKISECILNKIMKNMETSDRNTP